MRRSRAPLALLFLLGCGTVAQAPDAQVSAPLDAASPADDAASPPDAGTPPVDAGRDDVIAVAHRRELRAVWVATVYGIDFPSRAGLSASAARAELSAIVDRVASVGGNAIFFQVRPESDALYRSAHEPWSRFLAGTQGTDPGYDPLAVLLELAHARGLEVHAWMNPYRGLASASTSAHSSHVTRTLAEHAVPYGAGVWMDPGAPAVRAHVVAVVRDLLEHHAVDGVHFDDYFYPYPDEAGTPFDDDASWQAYVEGGGAMERADWRRENVNALVREVMATVREVRPAARFGISPFGIHRPGMPAGIRGLDAYATLYCDALAWIDEGTVDYVAPQLYWPTTQTAQAYGPLAAWWAAQTIDGIHLFPGHALHRLGSSDAWSIDELRAQIELTRTLHAEGAQGDVLFSYSQLEEDRLGVTSLLSELWAAPALPPAVPRALAAPEPPRVTLAGTALSITHDARDALRGFALYRDDTEGPILDRLLASDTTTLEVDPSERWLVSAVANGDVESLGAIPSAP